MSAPPRTDPDPTAAPLNYVPVARPLRRLVLDETDLTCRLTFPAPAAWIGWVNIAFALAGVASQLVTICMFVRQVMWMSSFNASLPPGTPPISIRSSFLALPFLMCFLSALVCTASALFHYVTLRREWRVRRFLEYGPNGLVYQRPTLFRRYRHWPVAEVLGVRINTIRSIIPRHRVVELVIKVHSGRSLRFRFAGPDKIALAELFAARASDILLSTNPLPLEPNLG